MAAHTDHEWMHESLLTLVRDELPDRYRDVRPLAQGGMGALFLAHDGVTDEDVAVKMLPPVMLGEKPAVARGRFLREAEIMSRLSHPYIVKIHEVSPGRRLPYYVMDYVRGETLQEYIRSHHERSVPQSLRIILDICEAVSHAHFKGVVHRDLKPENVFVLSPGGVKVLDFGLAKMSELTSITRTGDVLGTPLYMAPEQLFGGDIDARTDIYAIGVLMYLLVTGETPFNPENFYSKITTPPPAPGEKNAHLPASLDGVILKAMSIHARDRQASVDQLKWELSTCLSDFRLLTDLPIGSQSWESLLQSDLERLTLDATPIDEKISLIEGEVREVTLLILVISGLKKEDRLGFVRDRILRVLSSEVERFGGIIDRFGVEVVGAYFGSRSSTGRDHERAIRAGFRILEKVATINEILRTKGLDLHIAVGVDTARVTVGENASVQFEHFPIHSAIDDLHPGQVRIMQTVRDRLGTSCVIEVIERSPSGLSRILALRPADTASRLTQGRGQAPLEGRSEIMDHLTSIHREACGRMGLAPDDDRVLLLTLAGEPGIGKTRLIDQFLDLPTVQPGWTRLRGTASSYLKMPYLAINSMIREYFGLTEGTDPSTAREFMAMQVKDLGLETSTDSTDLDRILESLVFLLGLGQHGPQDVDSPLVLRRSIVEAITLFFSLIIDRLSGEKQLPAIVVLEDLQWLDDLSREVIENMLVELGQSLILLVTHRTPFRMPERWKRTCLYREIQVDSLDAVSSRRIIEAMLGSQDLPDPLIRDLVTRTGGNPFFIEESVNYLIDAGDLTFRQGCWVLSDEGNSGRTPVNVQAVVLSRFDLLPRRDREVLQVCAILGVSIDVPVLEEMAGQLWGRDLSLGQTLAQFEDLRFLERRERTEVASRERRTELTFRQTMARDVIFSTILDSNRLILHGLAARSIESVHLHSLEEHYAMLAYHLNRSSHTTDALRYTQLALEGAVRRYDQRSALRFADEALALLRQTDAGAAQSRSRDRYTVLSRRAQMYELTGRVQEQKHDIEAMMDLAQELGDDNLLADAQNRMSWYYWWNVGDFPVANELALQALQRKIKLRDLGGQADAFRNLGSISSLIGDYQESIGHHERALKLYQKVNDLSGEAASLCSLGINQGCMGHFEAAVDRVKEALVLDREIQDLRGIGRELRILGGFAGRVCRYDEAVRYHGEALLIDREIGYRKGEGLNLLALGDSWIALDQIDDAMESFKESLDIAMEIQAKTLMSQAFLGMAEAYGKRGSDTDREIGQICIQNSLEISEDIGAVDLKIRGLMVSAGLQTEPGVALDLTTHATNLLRGTVVSQVDAISVWLERARLLIESDQSESARDACSRAEDELERRVETFDGEETRRDFIARSRNVKLLATIRERLGRASSS